MNTKENKKFFKRLLSCFLVVIILFVIRYGISFTLSFTNNNYNKGLEQPSGIIKSQKELPDFKFGFSSIKNNGCGVVAVYNLLVKDNKKKELSEIIKKFDTFGSNFFALLGTDPIFMVAYLVGMGFSVDLCFDNFEEIFKEYRYAISLNLSKEFKAGHYSLLINNKDGTFDSINPTIDKMTIESYNKFYEKYYKIWYCIK